MNSLTDNFFGVNVEIPTHLVIRECRVKSVSNGKATIFSHIFFRLRSAGGLNFELALEHIPSRNGINLLSVAHIFRFCRLTIVGDFGIPVRVFYISTLLYYTLLYYTLLYYGVLKRRNSAVIHCFVYYGRISACHNYSKSGYVISIGISGSPSNSLLQAEAKEGVSLPSVVSFHNCPLGSW